MNNLRLLKYCIGHPEKPLDRNYMFIEKHVGLSLYIEKTKEIKKTLIAISQIIDKKSGRKVIKELYDDLRGNLLNYAQYSEFGCFINACDSRIEYVADDIKLLKNITKLYLENRGLNEIVPEEWIQAIIDKTSSRKKGSAGENKLMNILQKKEFVICSSLSNLINCKKAVSKFPSNKKVNKIFETKFGKKTQNKKLDLIIKQREKIYFLEAKHINTSGGGQNKQIKELIEVIAQKPKKKNYHHVAFLDGIYFNFLFNDKMAGEAKDNQNKLAKQRKDIKKCLKKNKNNYFLNTAGFRKLFC